MSHCYLREMCWWLLCAALALVLAYAPVYLDGGPTETQAAADVAADLQDALAQAQTERPDLWDEDSRARAQAAVQLVASGRAQP